MSIKSYLYQSRPEIAVASEYYGAYRNFRKAGFKKTPHGFKMAGLESMQDGSYENDETKKIIALIKNADVFKFPSCSICPIVISECCFVCCYNVSCP